MLEPDLTRVLGTKNILKGFNGYPPGTKTATKRAFTTHTPTWHPPLFYYVVLIVGQHKQKYS
jgi:hypothetical protein